MLKKSSILIILMLGCYFSVSAQLFGGKAKTIYVIPDNAKIFYKGQEVGSGTYTVKFGSEDFVVLKFTAPGYYERTVKLFKNNPNKTVSYTLEEDDAEKNSVEIDVANKWFEVTCKQGMSEDMIWKRLMSIAINNFENVEVRDKEAGWIKTAWTNSQFAYATVRTRLEVKIALGTGDAVVYRVRVSSEYAWNDCGRSDQCFKAYSRVLKKFEQVINELQNTVGSNF